MLKKWLERRKLREQWRKELHSGRSTGYFEYWLKAREEGTDIGIESGDVLKHLPNVPDGTPGRHEYKHPQMKVYVDTWEWNQEFRVWIRQSRSSSPLCFYCQEPFNAGWVTDHIMPRSRGGPDVRWNKVKPVHPEGNLRKEIQFVVPAAQRCGWDVARIIMDLHKGRTEEQLLIVLGLKKP